jgi:chromosome segregation ATPase
MNTSDYSATSYGNAPDAASAATQGSSKAVLAALRALQDKIRRLEAERAQAVDECNHLRNQIRSQEVEAEHVKQRDTLNNQRSLLEAKSAYDRLTSEKKSMEHQLTDLLEKNRNSERLVDKMKDKIAMLEGENDGLESRKRDLDEEQEKAEALLEATQRREQELTSTLVLESQKHENNLTATMKRLRSTEEELSRVQEEKLNFEGKLGELDTVVAQLLKVNEQLVAQLQGKYVRPGVGARQPVVRSKTSTLKTKTKKASAKAAAAKKGKDRDSGAGASARLTMSTAATRGHSTRAVQSDGTLDGEYLDELHKVYVSMAKDVISGKSAAKATKAGRDKLSSKSVGSLPAGKKKGAPKSRIAKRRADAGRKTVSAARSMNDSDSDSGVIRIPSAKKLDLMSEQEDVADSKDEDLKDAIAELEQEFGSLNDKYQSLLTGIHGDEGGNTRDLVDVIEKMHNKGDTLRALRSPK